MQHLQHLVKEQIKQSSELCDRALSEEASPSVAFTKLFELRSKEAENIIK